MVRNSVILDSLCVNMKILFLVCIINSRVKIYVTATALICYESSTENVPSEQLTTMILHMCSLRPSAHLYLTHCLTRMLHDSTFHLSTWKLSE